MKQEWNKVRLGDVADILNGFAFKSNKYVDEGIRVIRIANVQKGRIEDNYPAFYPKSEEKELTRYMLREGDLLMSLTGNVGRVGILQKEMLPAALNQRVACIRLKEKEISRDFLFYYFDSDFFEKECINSSHGAAQPNMSTVWLANYSIPVPSLSEQQRIVSLLDAEFERIDALKRNAEHQLKAAKDLFQSALKEMLTPKEGWEMKTLEDLVAKLADGSHNPPKGIEKNEYRMLSSRNINFGGLQNLSDVRYLSKEDFIMEDRRTRAQINDILLTIVGTIGRSYVIKKEDLPLTFQRSVAIMTPAEKIYSQYLMYYFNAIGDVLNENAHGAAQRGLYLNQLKTINVSFPSLPDQQRIAARLDEISEKVKALQANYEQTITLCNDLKQSLLKSIFA